MRTRQLLSAACLASLALLGASVVSAAPTKPTASSMQVSAATTRHPRASLQLALGRSKAWVGQAIPITLSAQFRDVEGVTLEGVPQLKSEAIFTSDLSREPRQATQIIDGQPVLVATWSGTLTPSSAGPLQLAVELPVRIRYREAVVQQRSRQPEEEDDPFQSMMNLDPTDPSSIDRIFRSMQRSFPMAFDEPSLGRAHDEAFTLKASSRPFEVQALPSVGRPPSFSGAVGQFELQASLSSDVGKTNEPLTLRVTVKGDGDIDRVELAGIASSSDWKAYPISAKLDSSPKQRRLSQKTFEQVLIPTHGGELTIPSLELPLFDPSTGQYRTARSAKLTVDVAGPPAAASGGDTTTLPVPPVPQSKAAPPVPPALLPPPAPDRLVDDPRALAVRLLPVLLIVMASLLTRLNWRGDPEKALRLCLRRSAKQGSASAFFDAARRLIVLHFARRWHIPESEVTPQALRTQLGASAEPLIEAISTSEALRFGRRNVEPVELGRLCSTIEESLRNAA